MKIIRKWNVSLVKETAKRYDLETKFVISPMDCHKVMNEVFDLKHATQEKFVMLALSTKNEVIGAFEVFIGSINASIVHPRELFQRLLLVNASSFVVGHNHPSGDPRPSKEDISVTERIKEAGNIMGIELLDHIIIGDTKYLSFREEGYIK
jgi:DNA repair protein RadC